MEPIQQLWIEFLSRPVWDILGTIADTLGLIAIVGTLIASTYTAIQAFRSRAEQALRNEKVTIIVQCKERDESKELPYQPRKSELTRAELLGLLGMLTEGRRFNVNHLSTPEFFKELLEIRETRGKNEMIIPCSSQEYRFFLPPEPREPLPTPNPAIPTIRTIQAPSPDSTAPITRTTQWKRLIQSIMRRS